MRVAIVAGHFMPEIGYQEVYLARACCRLGHDVRVVTSNRVSPSARALVRNPYETGLTLDGTYGFSVVRLRATAHLGSMVVARGVKRAVDEFAPHVVLALGAGKLFPYQLFTGGNSFKLVALFGDNSDYWDFSSAPLALRSVRARLSQRTLKDAIYRRAIEHADRVCLTTPETRSILDASVSPVLRQALARKQLVLALGYDPDEFFFSSEEREHVRQELRVNSDECVFVTVTRVNPKKGLESVVDSVTKLRATGKQVRYVIAGFLGNFYEAELRRYIAAQPEPQIFYCYPFFDHSQMRRLYCGADVGIWTKAAISIQESMGTGLPVLLESKPSVGHLVEPDVNGWHFQGGDLIAGMRSAIASAPSMPRDVIASYNYQRFSYDRIADEMLASV